MPSIHLSPFSPPRKKLRVPQPPDCSLIGQLLLPSLLGNPLRPSSTFCSVPNNIPAGIQGARHAQYGVSAADPHFYKLQSGLFPFGLQQLDYAAALPSRIPTNGEDDDKVSCLLTIGNLSPSPKKHSDASKAAPMFLLFGQPILTEQQISQSLCGDTAGSSSLNKKLENTANPSDGSGSAVLQNGPLDSSSGESIESETGHCKVFMESEDVGRTLNLSALGSYEELHRNLLNMFSLERSEMLGNVLYRDEAGTVKQTGDEPFSNFVKTARRLTILTSASSYNTGR